MKKRGKKFDKKFYIPIIAGVFIIIFAIFVISNASCTNAYKITSDIDVGDVIHTTITKECITSGDFQPLDQNELKSATDAKINYLKAVTYAYDINSTIQKYENEINNLSVMSSRYNNTVIQKEISSLQDQITSKQIDLNNAQENIVSTRNILNETIRNITVTVATEDERDKIISDINNINYIPVITFDQPTYTWTDRVYITIVDPKKNVDPKGIDTVGGHEDNKITIRTGRGTIENYMLTETGDDTGIFTGTIRLTGFSPYDPVGDGNQERQSGVTTQGGIGDSGLLAAGPGEELLAYYYFLDGQYVSTSANIDWNVGEVSFIDSSYEMGIAHIRLIDPDLNLDPYSIDHAPVKVYSTSDPAGFSLNLNETGDDTGIFDGTLHFSTKTSALDSTLLANKGDTITVSYWDRTLPRSYNYQTKTILATTQLK